MKARLAEARHAGLSAALGVCLDVHAAMVQLAARVSRPRPIAPDRPLDILVTGTFHSDNWLAAHLTPLVGSSLCGRVRMVATRTVPALPKVEQVQPPRWLRQLLGDVPARLTTFAWVALRTRPDVVGGFHLLFNGLASALLAPLVGARSLYICVGGGAELAGGGLQSENRLFGRLLRPEPELERRLSRAVQAFDDVVVMGTGAMRFLRERGVTARIHVVPGGVDGARFRPAQAPARYDLVLAGRLVPIKRVDVFLQAVSQVARMRPDVRAVIVGDGTLRGELEALAQALGLREHVVFAGRRDDVETYLQSSRVFVLTSDSEGLPLSIVEAMMCGLPVVAPDVGDVGDLVRDGENGFLVRERWPDAFAHRLLELLTDEPRRCRLSASARTAAQALETAHVSPRWDAILGAGPSRTARAPGEERVPW